jgi:hypothetical protein
MRLVILTAAAMLFGATVASAQPSPGVVTVPDQNPSTSDTRKIDQAKVPPGGANSATNGPLNTQENWRSSSGMNSDPDNPSGAPGTGLGLGTSPRR